MTKKQIDKLAEASYASGSLNEKKVQRIAADLSRNDLKRYIRTIKNFERKQNIEVVLSDSKYKGNIDEKMIKLLFPNKKIKYSVSGDLITGARIINDDIVYDYNLQNTLENIVENIRKQYD